jgi:carbon starvation protein CstA
MITEGVVALIWAAIGMSFYGGVDQLNVAMTAQKGNAAFIVNEISNSLLGKFGGALALIGVVAAPITSGDTAFRSARLIVADFLDFKQEPIKNRLAICIPLFTIGYFLTLIDFSIIWRYFAWSNQTLAVVVLWVISVSLMQQKKFYWVTLIPAVFMTAVTMSYLFFAPERFALSKRLSGILAAGISTIILLFFFVYQFRYRIRIS